MHNRFVNLGIFERLLNFAIHKMMPSGRSVQDGLAYWRIKILATILLVGAAWCLLALGTGIFLALRQNLWELLIINILGYALFFGLLFVRGLSYELRATVTLLWVYGVGVAVILIVGPLSGGPIYLFTCAIVAGILLGTYAAIWAVFINSLTLVVLCWLISRGFVGRDLPFFNSLEAMIAAVASFVVMNLVVAASVSVLVKGLTSSHHKEKLLTKRLEKEREALMAAKEQLEIEIDERRQAENALRANEKKYRLLADNASDIIWTMDIARQQLTYVSPSVAKVRGYTPEEAMGMSLMDILTPPSLKKLAAMFSNPAAALEQLQPGKFFTIEVEMYKKDGGTLWTELSISLIRESEGHPLIALGITRDISERKLAEQKRVDLETQLRQARKMEAIGTLAGGIAHDFNNILSAMIGYAELCLDDVPPRSLLQSNLREIFNAGIRAKELVKRILTFARQSDDEIKPIPMAEVVKEALQLIRSTTPSIIQIESNLASDALIRGNPTQIHQIMMNLCTNAAHAMEPDGGIMTIELEEIWIPSSRKDHPVDMEPGPYLMLTLADTGTGIPEEVLPSIFDPYFTTKEVGKGTGMGLAMVHGIVETCGGKIRVKSEVGKGTIFTLYLPVAGSDAPSAGGVRILSSPDRDRIPGELLH